MSKIKNAQLRYRVIDRILRNKHNQYPTKEVFRKECEDALYGNTEGENICDSTIEKDLFSMRMDHDAPIKYSKKYRGYYYENPEFSINNLPLTQDDMLAINFAVNTLSQFKESALFSHFGSAVDKISDHLQLNGHSQDLENYVQFESSTKSLGNEYLQPLLEAIKNKYLTEFDYASFQTGKSKLRKVLPLFLKEFRNRWYVICQDFDKNSLITYALERIKNLNIKEEQFKEKIEFNPQEFFKYSTGITAGSDLPQKIVFKASNVASKYIESQPFHASQKIIKEGKKKSIFEMNVLLSEELIRDFLSYGGDLEVVKPPLLKQEIVGRVVSLLNAYKS